MRRVPAGIQPLASVFSSVDDTEGLRAYAQEARAVGLTGGLHPPAPDTCDPPGIHPHDKEIERARRILAAFAEAAAAGSGVVTVDGRMVDARSLSGRGRCWPG